jgi:hypothetical protein
VLDREVYLLCLITTDISTCQLWTQLRLQPSLTIQHSPCPHTCLAIVISLRSLPFTSAHTKQPTHRLSNDVPYTHIKPPGDFSCWNLDQVTLELSITAPLHHTTSDCDAMLFQSSTLPDRADGATSSTKRQRGRRKTKVTPSSYQESLGNSSSDSDSIIALVDAALRLAIADLPTKAYSGVEIMEKSSFKHLEDICPSMWKLNHLEVQLIREAVLCCFLFTDNIPP